MIYFKMSTEKSNNGNSQLNSERANYNSRVSKYRILGKSRKVMWDNSRRNRTI
jgi:hypothetical protein